MSLVEKRFVGFIKPKSLVENHTLDPLLPNPKRLKTDPEIKISPSSRKCDHVPDGICIFCKSKLNITQRRLFNFLNQGIKTMSQEALASRKRLNSQTSWLDDKKLHLVLDLDHTLVHTIITSLLSQSDKYLIKEADLRNDLWRFDSGLPGERLIKLRPFVHQFLKEASDMFSMSVYTKGSCFYAQVVLELIDPDKTYFGDRVISTRECSGKNKTLDLVLADERGIVIVDDTSSVWTHHKKNLLQIVRYKYFRQSNESLECKKERDESDENGPLASVLSFLKEVHKRFFCDLWEQELDSMDVRPLLQDHSSISVERKRKISAGSVLNL